MLRTRETRSQVGLQQQNDKKIWLMHSGRIRKLVKEKNILVVDDVATSGATLNACAKALLDEGASKVYGFSLARAVFTPNMEIDLS